MRLLLCLVLLLAACSRDGVSAQSRDSATTVPLEDAAAFQGHDARGADDAGAADAAVADAAVDAPPQVAPGDGGWAGYVRAVDERFDQYSTRVASCFNGSLDLLRARREPLDADPALSVELGQIVVDEAALRACVAALGSATCDELANVASGPTERWRGPFEPCGRIIVARVPAGERCRHDDACMSGQCADYDQACGAGHCQAPTPAAAVGANCAHQPCTVDAFCDGLDDNQFCRPLGTADAPCRTEEQCAFGFFCSHDDPGALAGHCQPIARGTPCAGSWQCAGVYACVGAGAGRAGTCQPGKPVGEPCVVQAQLDDSKPISDCGFGLQCLNLDGRGSRCRAGSQVGETCGSVDGGPYSYCLQGFCNRATLAQSGSCAAAQQSGPCTYDEGCVPPAVCAPWEPSQGNVCRVPPKLGPGAACITNDIRTPCGLLAYCRPNAPLPASDAQVPGTCRSFAKAGERCTEGQDRCEIFTACTAGVCTKC